MPIKQAMRLAEARGMVIVPSPTNPALGRIRCQKCEWPNTPHDVFDVVLERYLLEPHGCAVCTGKAVARVVVQNSHATLRRQPG